jgi:hypothetical protein
VRSITNIYKLENMHEDNLNSNRAENDENNSNEEEHKRTVEGLARIRREEEQERLERIKRFIDGDEDSLKAYLSKGKPGYMKRNIFLREAIQIFKDRSGPAIDVILSAGADVNKKDENGRTALHHAMISMPFSVNSRIIINKLLEKGANVNAVDNLGNTPLHYFVESLSKYTNRQKAGNIGKINSDFGHLYKKDSADKIELLAFKQGTFYTSCDIKSNGLLEARKILKALTLKGARMDISNKSKKFPLEPLNQNTDLLRSVVGYNIKLEQQRVYQNIAKENLSQSMGR